MLHGKGFKTDHNFQTRDSHIIHKIRKIIFLFLDIKQKTNYQIWYLYKMYLARINIRAIWVWWKDLQILNLRQYFN